MPSPDYIAKPPDGFSVLSIVRGFQLTFLGAYRALQNPDLLRAKYYKQALYAVLISLGIQFIISIPLWIFKISIKIFAWFLTSSDSPDAGAHAQSIIQNVEFVEEHVINLSGLLIGLMRYLRPEMDEMFIESLKFIDQVYFNMHPEKAVAVELPDGTLTQGPSRFYSPISQYSVSSTQATLNKRDPPEKKTNGTSVDFSSNNAAKFIARYVRRSVLSVGIYFFSSVPYLGTIVLPIVSFLSFRKTVGATAAVVVFGSGLFVPRKMLTRFIAAYWGGRSLCRELLIPYFARIPFSRQERDQWYRAREGVLFGFGFGFYFILKMPYIGVLMYGIAEASAAYLVTKVTDPPPPPAYIAEWTQTQTRWNKREKMLTSGIVASDGFAPVIRPASVMPGAWGDSKNKSKTEDDVKQAITTESDKTK
ncbi:uncharacterized protein V2V93DRAFT_364423 [Kockiozyma suomiensis]|uniref:uncharacterized protein n=1 Tax=Kockiozyma suomiensis TaxID=1337062 RepID=UPI003343DBBB